jgi:nicotinate-nucleotide adenylyltransferase
MPQRLGLLGGTFDPIHLGHVAAGRAARAALALDRLQLVPAHVPPHRALEPRASSHHRFAMAAIAALDEPSWTVSDVELRRGGPSFTFDTLRELQLTGLAPGQIFFITGADAFAEIATWSRFPTVLDQAHFVVVTRPGTALAEFEARVPALAGRVRAPARVGEGAGTAIVLVEAETPDVSSTAIRARAAGGYSLAGLVPPRVEQYIRRQGLYAASAIEAGALHGQDE